MQGWRTIAAVARELGITDRTLRKRLKEAGIHPARPDERRLGYRCDKFNGGEPDAQQILNHSRWSRNRCRNAPGTGKTY